ncbi:GLPGLI family protein [Mariniflexile sp.]|uniref:GLPGLI family protein n=1 Tax=Mariniflexile sp. TaxID=1979402 RepID=UPI004047CE0E
MKLHFKKLNIIVFVLLVSVCAFGQKDFQGKAYYFSKTTVDMSNFGRPGMSEDQKKQIAERMKSMLEKTFVLTFNQSESLYKEEEKLEAPGAGGSRFGMMMGSMTSGPQYKNIKDQLLLQEQELFGKQFLVKDSLPKFDWIMESETKQIGQYTCFKATATKTVDAESGFNFRRPPDDEKTDAPTTKDIQIVAWYTMQIPVNQGPSDYWGLPGLILEVSADKTIILCSKIVLNPEVKDVIKVPSKGKEITKIEYDEIVKKKTAEIRENFRSRGGPGGGRR